MPRLLVNRDCFEALRFGELSIEGPTGDAGRLGELLWEEEAREAGTEGFLVQTITMSPSLSTPFPSFGMAM